MPERLNFAETVAALRDPNCPPHFLAMDQSEGTHKKHMQQFGVPIADEADFQRKGVAARQMLATTPGLGRYFGGAIVHDDLFGLTDAEGRPLQDSLRENGVLVIGKKLGLDKNTGLATELDQLCAGMRELVERWGVHLIKTRTTITYGKGHATDAAEQMVQVHRQAAKNGGMMAILEPEFIKDNAGSLGENEDLMTQVLGSIIDGINREGLEQHPYAIKTSFPTPGGTSGEKINPEACAQAFKSICERAEIPEDLLIVFLSGGHSPETSRELLQAMAKVRKNVGSSFSRANVERPYRETFPADGSINIAAGQEATAMEGLKNLRAMEGRYRRTMEQAQRLSDLNV